MRQIQNLRGRLNKLERSPQAQRRPTRLELIKSVALNNLDSDDLEVLLLIAKEQAAQKPLREFSEREAAACAGWNAALETQARRMGFKTCAEAEKAEGQRP